MGDWISMERKSISLKGYLVKFLLQVFLSMVVAMGIWLAAFTAVLVTRQVIPANDTERKVQQWKKETESLGEAQAARLPGDVGYAVYSLDGSLQESNFTEKRLEMAESFFQSGDKMWRSGLGTEIHERVETDSQVVVVFYVLRARFKNPVLQKVFPDFEITGLVVLFVMLLAGWCVCILYTAKKLGKKVAFMQKAAEEIGRQNLEFQVKDTGIREFDQVMGSLTQLKTELQDSLQQRWRLEQERGEQMAALAHDIKTPLTVLQGNAQLLEETRLSEEQRMYLDYILENEGRIGRFVARLIELSRKEGEGGTVERSCDLRKLVGELQADLESLGREKRLLIVSDVEGVPEEVPVNEEDLRRMLWNLGENAVQYSPRNGKIRIFCVYSDKKLRLTVSDQGRGFSEEEQRLGADAFFRGDPSRGGKEHFGLGLAIVKKLAAEYGGKLILKNAADGGAEAEILLNME